MHKKRKLKRKKLKRRSMLEHDCMTGQAKQMKEALKSDRRSE